MKKIAFILFLLTILSCRKETEVDPLISSAEDNAEVSAIFDDIDNETNDVVSLNLDVMKTASISDSSQGTRTITDTMIANNRVFIVEYKNFQNINSNNLRIKNGKIMIEINARNENEVMPSKTTLTFMDFTVNGNKIEGTRVVEKDPNAIGVFNITLTGGKITYAIDGTSYTRETETRTRTWVAGIETPLYIVLKAQELLKKIKAILWFFISRLLAEK